MNSKLRLSIAVLLIAVMATVIGVWHHGSSAQDMVSSGMRIEMPDPEIDGGMALQRAIAQRRSIRSFADQPLELSQLGQLLWAAQGLTEDDYRASPSAGATYPLEVFVVVGERMHDALAAGVYQYDPAEHAITQVRRGEVREELARAALNQGFLAEAPVVIAIAADYSRTTQRYGDRGRRYVHMEAGHAGQNIYLQCQALDLGTVAVGAFNDRQVRQITAMAENLDPLYLMPIGVPRN